MAHPFHAAIEAVDALPFPVVAAINGHALGGGLELAVSLRPPGLRRGAKLGMPPAKLGLIYGHTGLQRFIDASASPAPRSCSTGRNVNAERAEQIGLVQPVVAATSSRTPALELAAEIAGTPRSRCAGNKYAIETLAASRALYAERSGELVELRESCFRSEDFREGVRPSARSASRAGRAADAAHRIEPQPTREAENVNDDAARKDARQRLEAKQGFRNFAFVFVLVSAMLIGIWAISGSGYFWPVFPIGGMAIALAFRPGTSSARGDRSPRPPSTARSSASAGPEPG